MNQATASISRLRSRVLKEFYKGKSSKEACRDTVAITKSIARYGFLCKERGWLFNAGDIEEHIGQILTKMSGYSDVIKYFPVYLDRSIDQWVMKKAEQYSAEARAMENVANRVMMGINTKGKGQSDDTEQWSQIWERLRVGKRKEPKEPKGLNKRYEAEQFEMKFK